MLQDLNSPKEKRAVCEPKGNTETFESFVEKVADMFESETPPEHVLKAEQEKELSRIDFSPESCSGLDEGLLRLKYWCDNPPLSPNDLYLMIMKCCQSISYTQNGVSPRPITLLKKVDYAVPITVQNNHREIVSFHLSRIKDEVLWVEKVLPTTPNKASIISGFLKRMREYALLLSQNLIFYVR